MKKFIKQVLQSVWAIAAPIAWRWKREPQLLVLMYHRVLPVEHPDRKFEQPGMYVSPQTLEMHLAVLQDHFQLVHLEEWLDDAANDRSLPDRACAITFDDGWRDNYEYAYPILSRAQAPATIFLVADAVGTQYTFWPNRLARLLTDPTLYQSRTQLPRWLQQIINEVCGQQVSSMPTLSEIDRVIGTCKNLRADTEMLDALDGILDNDQKRDLFDWKEARLMLDSGLIRFGSHTRRHTRLLPHIDFATLEDEIIGSKNQVKDQLGAEPRTFCYPNGDYSSAALVEVQRTYLGAVTTARGWNTRASDACLLRRVGMHEDVSNTPSAFLSRLAGVG